MGERDLAYLTPDVVLLADEFERLGKTAEAEFQKEARVFWAETATEIRAKARTRLMRKAARTVRVEGNDLVGGGDEIFMGAEFGGGGPPGSPGGRRTNGRRSTKQFGRHTGIRGRFFHPVLRKKLPGLGRLVEEWLDERIPEWP